MRGLVAGGIAFLGLSWVRHRSIKTGDVGCHGLDLAFGGNHLVAELLSTG